MAIHSYFLFFCLGKGIGRGPGAGSCGCGRSPAGRKTGPESTDIIRPFLGGGKTLWRAVRFKAQD